MWTNLTVGVVLGCTLPAGASLQASPLLDTGMLLAPASYIGLGVMDLNEDAVRDLGLIEPHGIEITSVVDGSPAGDAGLRRGDIVLTYRGDTVQGYEHFARLVRETPAGRTVELGIVRDGERMRLDVEIGRREVEVSMSQAIDEVRQRIERARRSVGDAQAHWGLDFSFPQVHVSSRSRRLGVALEDLSGQLAQYFGVERGVLVREVREGSPAEESGLRAGDVIVTVEGKAVRTAVHCGRHLSETEGAVLVEVMRDRARVTLEIDLRPASRPVAIRPGPDSN